jgi:uncharacterized membrane protein YdjX (TVP38/TMEM64 family)
MENDKRFAALALTLKYDGLKLLCMIRLCPLPYSICNGAMSTFPTVTPLNYALATAIITPKLMVAAFIGSRLRELSKNNEEMSAGAKAVNVISIFVSITVAVGTGFYIYQRFVDPWPPTSMRPPLLTIPLQNPCARQTAGGGGACWHSAIRASRSRREAPT